MASMIFASSPLSVQSFVKLTTNSNYSHSPCYVSRAKNSYIRLPFKNISNIQSSKSLFTKGDVNLSFSSQKFPRVASKYSPSLNIIKASTESQNIYHFWVHDVETGKAIQEIGDTYRGHILLIVNLPQKISSKVEEEITFLNGLRNRYKEKAKNSSYKGFEVLGFFPYKSTWLTSPRHRTKEEKHGEEVIQQLAEFPIFRKGHDDDDREFWDFLRKVKVDKTMEKEFEKYVVDGAGKCVKYFPWFEGETLEDSEGPTPGGSPGDIHREEGLEDPGNLVVNAIAKYFP